MRSRGHNQSPSNAKLKRTQRKKQALNFILKKTENVSRARSNVTDDRHGWLSDKDWANRATRREAVSVGSTSYERGGAAAWQSARASPPLPHFPTSRRTFPAAASHLLGTLRPWYRDRVNWQTLWIFPMGNKTKMVLKTSGTFLFRFVCKKPRNIDVVFTHIKIHSMMLMKFHEEH